ncbi:MAG: Rab family GTPase [Candidatus Helarchaeota archaeon]
MTPLYGFKLILFGNQAVGKTSLVQRYVNNKFEQEYISTLGYNVFEKLFEIKDNKMSLMIYDIGGQERFDDLRRQYALGAKAAFIVYDITDRESFENVRKWSSDLAEFTDDALFVLIGNKLDLEESRVVSTEEGRNMAAEVGAESFFETSAKTGHEVNNAFVKIAHILLEKSLNKA